MKRLIYGTMGMVLILVAHLSSQIVPVTPSSVPVHDLSLNRRTIDVLVTLAEKYHVVIGIYGTFIGSDSQTINISFKDGTLGEVFDAIVKADPRFEWQQTNNGAIHFVFRDSPLSLLDVTVHSFDVENPRRMEMSDHLLRLPEVSGWLQAHSCIMDEMIAGKLPKEWGKFVVHTRDIPLSAVFDEIAAKSGTYFWLAIQYHADPCAINMTP